jgi:homospermidine synthase
MTALGAAVPGRTLVLGCGSVAQCTLPLLIDEVGLAPSSITVMDMVDNQARIAAQLARGVTYEIGQITPENLDAELSARLGDGDLLIDLAWNIDGNVILQWCHDRGVRYLNTSLEVWDPYEGGASIHPLERTLYVRHMSMRRMISTWSKPGPTAVIEHGANPGLVSHWVKQALNDIGTKLVGELAPSERRDALQMAMDDDRYNDLAMLTGTKVVHVSERDTQISDQPKEPGEFVNTWSIDGFYEEGIAPGELGWGTHEKRLPRGAYVHTTQGPRNQIALASPGMSTLVRSWTPAGPIRGMVVRHGEGFTMSDHLTVWDDHGKAIYRPTVHYAYSPSDAALASCEELLANDWKMQSRQRIMNDEITSGADILGVLVMGHDYQSWWTGSLLSIDEARALLPGQSATTLQVAASIIGAVTWMIDNPDEGVNVPDDLPWRDVMNVANRYLGTLYSAPVDWNPLTGRVSPFAGWDDQQLDPSDPWQFTNFLI